MALRGLIFLRFILVFTFIIFFSSTISFAQTKVEIGSYETPILDKSPGRQTNIMLSTQKINNFVLNPGQTFSFNAVVGPRTKERGFKKAKIFINRRVVDGYGGGICQVSSTLYQAAVKAGLKITEVHRHSLNVSYIERGKDAAVSYGYLDLKFQNNTENKIIIEGMTDKNKVVVKIFKIVEHEKFNDAKFYLKGEEIKFNNDVYKIKGTTYVPLRELCNIFGVNIGWDGATRSVSLYPENKEVTLKVDSNIAFIDGIETKLISEPKTINNTVYVPIKILSDLFGSYIGWNGETKSIYIH